MKIAYLLRCKLVDKTSLWVTWLGKIKREVIIDYFYEEGVTFLVYEPDSAFCA